MTLSSDQRAQVRSIVVGAYERQGRHLAAENKSSAAEDSLKSAMGMAHGDEKVRIAATILGIINDRVKSAHNYGDQVTHNLHRFTFIYENPDAFGHEYQTLMDSATEDLKRLKENAPNMPLKNTYVAAINRTLGIDVPSRGVMGALYGASSRVLLWVRRLWGGPS